MRHAALLAGKDAHRAGRPARAQFSCVLPGTRGRNFLATGSESAKKEACVSWATFLVLALGELLVAEMSITSFVGNVTDSHTSINSFPLHVLAVCGR